MDTLRGTFDTGVPADDSDDWDAETRPDTENRREAASRESPPEAIGQDERRMQVRAYNHWASLLDDATFPSIEDLEPQELTDFGPNSVLLDFSHGIENPGVQYLGDKLAEECGVASSSSATPINTLSDVPPRSLLSRITDHYMQILANQAPIGFEAEFMNQRGAAIMYRGILLPYSSDDETIDFIFGVINWKEMADAAMADELLLEIDQALENSGEQRADTEDQPHRHHADPVTEWADSPAHEPEVMGIRQVNSLSSVESGTQSSKIASLGESSDSELNAGINFDQSGGEDGGDLPMPDFGQYALGDPEEDEDGDDGDEGDASYSFASLADYIEAPTKKAVDLDDYQPEDESESAEAEEISSEETTQDTAPKPGLFGSSPPKRAPLVLQNVAPADFAPASELGTEFDLETPDTGEETGEETAEIAIDPQAGLHDCLASARELAHSASASEDRSRHALYAAVGRAYDFSLASKDEPEEYNELIEDSGLTVQDRAPMTPIVKLVFGHDYDKTRLTEYAAVLSHAHRLELDRGSLAQYLRSADGGLKGVVHAERRLRREDSGKEVESEGDVRAQLAQKLRELEELTLEALSGDGPEFSLAMIRRDTSGKAVLIGEISDDLALIERVGKKLVG